MDVEAALLEGSPTMSTISSDYTDQTYAESSSSSPDSPKMSSPLFVAKILDDEDTDELTPKIIISQHAIRKPKFRIRPPYLMICVSLIQVRDVSTY